MAALPASQHHVLVARGASAGTIAGATLGAAAAAILMLICSLPFLLKCRRKRRARRRHQEEEALRPEMGGVPGTRPASQVFPPHPNRFSHVSQSRLASAAATLSDHDSQTGKEYGLDGITYHRSAAPSPALVGKTLRTCSPAPSIVMPPSSTSLAAASRKNSPAVGQGPFPPPAHKDVGSRAPTFGTMTTEPEQLSRSPTGSQHGSQSPSIGGAFRKIHDKVFHRDSTRSSGSDSRKTGSRSPDMDLDDLDRTQTDASGPPEAPYRDEKPVMGGLAEEYYLGADLGPLSPPEEPQLRVTSENYHSSHLSNLMAVPGAALAGVGAAAAHSQTLGSPFNTPGAPLSPSSPLLKDEDLSSEEGGKESFEKSDTLSPPPASARGLPTSSPSKRFEPPPSPSHPDPGTVNPMDMMKPSTAAEQAAWVDTELWKMENSPSPRINDKLPSPSPQPEPHTFPPLPSDSLPPSQPQPFTPAQQQEPSPTPERPLFQAVIRHPTQMDVTTNRQAMPQHDEQVITDISDTSSPGPGFDQYAYGPSPSDHTSPDTRLTDSAFTGSPSPRSSMNSNRPASSFGGTDYLGTSPGNQSRPASQEGTSPKATSFACEICGSKFDQVHKLNHHKRYHERPHQCPQCDKRFGTKTHLDRHINDKHNKTRKYHCTVGGCAYAKQGGGKSFPRKDNWRRHMQNKHSVQNPPEPIEEDVIMDEAI